MGTAIGPAIDWLCNTLPSLVTAVSSDALVIDAYADAVISDTMVYIGRDGPETGKATEGTRAFPTLGTRNIDEEFSIPCFIDVYRDGTAAKTARDAALGVYDVVCHLLVTDPSMGGAIHSTWASVGPVIFYQYPDVNVTARHRAVVAFTIQAKNRYGA